MPFFTLFTLSLVLVVSSAAVQAGGTVRVAVDSAGAQGNSGSFVPSLSAKGRVVAFASGATNLVAGDTNAATDIFVHDLKTGQTVRVAVDSAGGQGNDSSFVPSLSANGRVVAFDSLATNLVAGDTNGHRDVFVHDLTTGQTVRVSVDSVGVQGNFGSFVPSLSANGRWVGFASGATNLVAGDTNEAGDVFVHDLTTGQTVRVSVDSASAQGNDSSSDPSLSANGRVVAFQSFATNLVAGDTNGAGDVFVHDRRTGQTVRVSVDSAGVQGNSSSFDPSLSANGRWVAFQSFATNLVAGDTNGDRDIFVHDLTTGETVRVSVNSAGIQGNSESFFASISAKGRVVAFTSDASNLVAEDTNGDSDVFVHYRK